MNRHGILALGASVALMLVAAASAPATRSTKHTASAGTSHTYQVSAHAVRRSGYIVASS